MVSHKRMFIQLTNIPGNTLAKDEPGNCSPKRVLNWAVITVVAAAEQKPDMTGPDINSITHPKQESTK